MCYTLRYKSLENVKVGVKFMMYLDLIMSVPEEWRPFVPLILLGILAILLVIYYFYEHFKG